VVLHRASAQAEKVHDAATLSDLSEIKRGNKGQKGWLFVG
jgi:hypothetical protein